MNKGKLVVAGAGTDPSTTLSYGILLRYLTETTSTKYNWNLLVEGHNYGPPIMHKHYNNWASGKGVVERDTKYIPYIIEKTKPEFFYTVGDPQFIRNTRMFIPKTIPWIHWLPIDHHDDEIIIRNKYLFDSMDVCVPMSKHAYDMCKRNKIKTYPYIYPFINDKEFSPIEEEKEPDLFDSLQKLRNELKIGDKKVLLFVGRPGWRKNLEMLLGAYKKLLSERGRDDVHLYLHTNINDDDAKEFNVGKMMHAIGLKNTDFSITQGMDLGVGTPKFYLRGLYNLADVYVSTHGGEGFGMPIAEAMCAETPFVCTDCTTTEELAGNGERGLAAKIAINRPDRGIIRPYVDIDDFCDKIEYLLDHEKERQRMGKKGKEWVKKTCSINVVRRKWLKLFDSLIVNKVKIGGLIDGSNG